MDEGDEDREAGIAEDEDEGSDLDIGDDPDDTGKPRRSFHPPPFRAVKYDIKR